jgi:hypothetical protein
VMLTRPVGEDKGRLRQTRVEGVNPLRPADGPERVVADQAASAACLL